MTDNNNFVSDSNELKKYVIQKLSEFITVDVFWKELFNKEETKSYQSHIKAISKVYQRYI